MLEVIAYAPLVMNLLVVWAIGLATRRFYFGITMGVLALSYAAHALLAYTMGNLVFTLIQGALGVLLFVVLVYFVGKKASGETLLVMVGTFMLVPLFFGVWALALGMVFLISYSSYFIIKQQGRTLSGIAADAAMQTGVLTASIPTFEYIPDATEAEGRRISAAPHFLAASVIVAAIAGFINL